MSLLYTKTKINFFNKLPSNPLLALQRKSLMLNGKKINLDYKTTIYSGWRSVLRPDKNVLGPYVEPRHIYEQSPEEIEDLKKKYEIEAPKDIKPIHAFDDLPIPQNFKDVLNNLFPNGPTPFQKFALPCNFSNNNVLYIAPIGSGTLYSLAIPAIARILKNKDNKKLTIFVTLSKGNKNYVENELFHLTQPLGIKLVNIDDGETIEKYKSTPHILVTPIQKLIDMIMYDKIYIGKMLSFVFLEINRISIAKQIQMLKLLSSANHDCHFAFDCHYWTNWRHRYLGLEDKFCLKKVCVKDSEYKTIKTIENVLIKKTKNSISRIIDMIQQKNSKIFIIVNKKTDIDTFTKAFDEKIVRYCVMDQNNAESPRLARMFLNGTYDVVIGIFGEIPIRRFTSSSIYFVFYSFPFSIYNFIEKLELLKEKAISFETHIGPDDMIHSVRLKQYLSKMGTEIPKFLNQKIKI